MQRRSYVVVAVALAVLLVGAGVAAALGGTNADVQTRTTGDGATVSVGASGSAEATPDRAVIRLAVVATADTASEARDRLAANVSGMRDALRDAGVEDAQVRTTNYGLSENYEARENPEAPGYRAYHGFQVTLDDIDTVGAVIDAAVDGGATRVENVQFTLSDERARELRDAALTDAMENARSQAETLADAGDLTLGGVHSAATSQGYYGGPVAYETADAGARTTVESGPVTVTVQVQVTYNATEA